MDSERLRDIKLISYFLYMLIFQDDTAIMIFEGYLCFLIGSLQLILVRYSNKQCKEGEKHITNKLLILRIS